MLAWITPVGYWWGDPPTLHLSPDSDTRSQSRRMSRTPTLDGGAVVTDAGYSDADRTFTLVLDQITQDDADALTAIAAVGLCHCALDHGLYQGYVKDHAITGPESARLTFWVTSKIT